VGNRADADELFQEVSVTLWRKFNVFERGTDFRAWAFSIVRNKVMSFRQLKRHQLIFSTELVDLIASQATTSAGEIDHKFQWLDECLAKLNVYQRQLLDARYGQNRQITAIAVQMAKSVDAVYKDFQRIHRNLRTCLNSRAASELHA
jgi:RNA polymerase sigma-70 factor, ECF subfamily